MTHFYFFDDIFQIIGGTTAAIAAAGTGGDNNLWCGRNFATADATAFNAAGTSVCSE